jgi:hypothetical protein
MYMYQDFSDSFVHFLNNEQTFYTIPLNCGINTQIEHLTPRETMH